MKEEWQSQELGLLNGNDYKETPNEETGSEVREFEFGRNAGDGEMRWNLFTSELNWLKEGRERETNHDNRSHEFRAFFSSSRPFSCVEMNISRNSRERKKQIKSVFSLSAFFSLIIERNQDGEGTSNTNSSWWWVKKWKERMAREKKSDVRFV